MRSAALSAAIPSQQRLYQRALTQRPNSGSSATRVVLLVILASLIGCVILFNLQFANRVPPVTSNAKGNPGQPVNNPGLPVGPGTVPPVPVKKLSFVGRWDVTRSGTNSGKNVAGYMRFKNDGTFTSTLAFLATTDGKYNTISGSVVELDFPGIVSGRNKLEFTYTLTSDRLALQYSKNRIDLEFKRVDWGQ